MKKYTAISLSLALALILAACSPAPQPGNDNPPVSTPASVGSAPSTSVPTQTTPAPVPSGVTLEQQVIYDKDGIRVTVTGLGTDDFWGPAINVLVENTTSRNITVQTRNASVNDLMLDPMFSCDVAAGKKANDQIVLMSSDLENMGISTIASIEFILHVFDSDTWDDIDDSEIITLHTSAADHVQAYDDSGYAAYHDDGIRIVVQKADSENSFWGSDVYVYVQNDTPDNITIQVRNVSINGYMVEPMFSCDVAAGKKAYDAISFLQSDLEDNGISDIHELELEFYIFDSDTWDDIDDTDSITITFQ